MIETIARQSWVLNHKVGMMGISYGGISQLFTAQLDPPDLEAIAPLSVIATSDRQRGRTGAWVELARYSVAAGDRVPYGQRVDGVVRVTDVP